ncbi:MAG: hydantoinase B/oxoprolinase family protein [Chloroflexi bacterium]|nr:hydantoinase B/oxoprolinase family protein [Chloroflexota bacterium]
MAVDPISLQVFANVFAAVPEEMGAALRRASFSPNIRERLDFSCAIFDSSARMIAQAAHIPVHLGSMPASVLSAIDTIPEWMPGDTVVVNDPYHGGSHLPDITLISPVFVNDRLEFFVASRAHHADVGGMSPGSLPLSTELYQEGVIIPPVKLVEHGVLNAALFTLLTVNARGGDERTGDYEAQLSSNRTGAKALEDLVATYGLDLLREHADALIEYTRRMTEEVIRGLPDGTYRFTDYMEGDGTSDDLHAICVELRIEDDRMIVDFAGSSASVRGNVNTVEAVVKSAVMYCIRLLAGSDYPFNAGAFEPVDVLVPRGSMLNAEFPRAVAVGNTETSQRVVDAVLGALAQATPDRVPAASQGSMNNITIGSGGLVYYETIAGGMGAGPFGHGANGRHSHMTNTRNTPVESLERSYPLRVLRYGLRDGTGGAGVHTGGAGIVREYEITTAATVTINSERRKLQPYGMQGGAPGAAGKNRLIGNDGTETALAAKATVSAVPGDRIIIWTPGGGGWGMPKDA